MSCKSADDPATAAEPGEGATQYEGPSEGPTTLADRRVKVSVLRLARAFGLRLFEIPPTRPIPHSYWGAPEAGVLRRRIYYRVDTPLHSMLHEMAHVVCMGAERRAVLDRDAGGDDLEEAAVCYLQILLADGIDGVDRDSLCRDMDAWGYSFREGSTRRWFDRDAEDAQRWLVAAGQLDSAGRPLLRRLDFA